MCHTKYGTPTTNGGAKKQKVHPVLPGQTTLAFGVGIARPDTPAVVIPPRKEPEVVIMDTLSARR